MKNTKVCQSSWLWHNWLKVCLGFSTDPAEDYIGPDGVGQFLNDIGVDAEDVRYNN